jgi:endonuclease/exonuclease/phosphatase (EEP) superfamily protein YafD
MTETKPVATLYTTLGRALLGCVRLGAIFVLLFTVASFFARYHWRCEQLCHFRLQYAWLLVAAAASLLFAKDRRFGIIAAVGAIANFVFIVPIYFPADQPSHGGQPWKLISYNVRTRNQHHLDVSAWLRQQQADVILLMEIDGRWGQMIRELRDVYPHQHIIERDDNFGIALVSRIPWESVPTEEFDSAEVPSIVAEFKMNGQPVTFVGSHPVPPGSAGNAASRNELLFAVARLAKQTPGQFIAAGDLNVTSYSPYFRDLLRDGNLRDSRQGRGVQASWSRLYMFTIPIDHCLVSPQVEVVSRRVGPHLGSDHRPVIVELRTSE